MSARLSVALLPAVLAGALLGGCAPPTDDEALDGDEAALEAACGLGSVRTTLITPEFTSSIPQALTRLRITARNVGSRKCSVGGTIEVRKDGKLVNTEKIPARDFAAGFNPVNRGLSRQYSPPVTVNVCWGPSFTCLSKTINPPIGE